MLFDLETREIIFDVNFWHYRALVESLRLLEVLPSSKIDSLHEPWCSNGLTSTEARIVAAAIRTKLLPRLDDDARLLLDGTVTKTPDDGEFHRDIENFHKNYSTNRRVLEMFAQCCEICNGFEVC